MALAQGAQCLLLELQGCCSTAEISTGRWLQCYAIVYGRSFCATYVLLRCLHVCSCRNGWIGCVCGLALLTTVVESVRMYCFPILQHTNRCAYVTAAMPYLHLALATRIHGCSSEVTRLGLFLPARACTYAVACLDAAMLCNCCLLANLFSFAILTTLNPHSQYFS
jgi:hypothetical protein